VRCRWCGGAREESYETLVYVGPGPCAVDLQRVHVLRCTTCAHVAIDVPEPRALDILIRCLRAERGDAVPQLTFEHGHWRVAGRKVLN
jgi:hypothetical protein